MGARLGDVEIKAIQRAVAVEARRAAVPGAPGQRGAVAQDLGHRPAVVELEGLLFGDDASSDLETLRAAWQKGKPLSFASDVVTGTAITEVVIEDLRVDQQAGRVNTWRCALRLREHTVPPPKPGFGLLDVLKGILKDAGKWMKLAQSVMRVLKDPSCLLDELSKNAGLLDMLGMGDLANSIMDNLQSLLPEDLAGIVEAIGKIDPRKVVELIEKIKDADSLEDLLKQGGLSTVESIVGAVGGEEAARLFKEGAEAAEAAYNVATNPQLIGDLRDLVEAARRIGATLSKPADLLPGGFP